MASVLSLVIAMLTTSPAASLAADPAELPGAIQVAVSTTAEELLLFWDEKDLLVAESATRQEKPVAQSAENITVITARDIEEMNAGTLAEVLDRVTGLFVDFQGRDFSSAALLYVQDGVGRNIPERHVLVVVDGMPWNFVGDGHAEMINLPARIIERIEIIKGPASSSWGSSLGGVINIVTKEPGKTAVPAGTLAASYGTANSQDYGAQLSGLVGPVGYYLSGGYRSSDGLRDERETWKNDAFAKFSLPLGKTSLGFSLGYGGSHFLPVQYPASDLLNGFNLNAVYANLTLDSQLRPEVRLQASLYRIDSEFKSTNNVLSTSEVFQNMHNDESTTGGNAKLVYTGRRHTAVLGVDVSHGNMDQTLEAGPALQAYGVSPTATVRGNSTKWAVFANDTLLLGDFALTLGLRYDDNDQSGSFTSPSLGATYQAGEHTVLRASVARGFTSPPLIFTSAGALFLDPNPDLKPEAVWSYQAGIESSLSDYAWVKATAFYHDLEDALYREPYGGAAPVFNDIVVNFGDVTRRGIELQAATVPIHNVSLTAGWCYVERTANIVERVHNYMDEVNLGLKYDDRKAFLAQIFGHRVHWGVEDPTVGAKDGTFLWDLNVRYRLFPGARVRPTLFASVHNLFDADQYSMAISKNPGRWVEAGLSCDF